MWETRTGFVFVYVLCMWGTGNHASTCGDQTEVNIRMPTPWVGLLRSIIEGAIDWIQETSHEESGKGFQSGKHAC